MDGNSVYSKVGYKLKNPNVDFSKPKKIGKRKGSILDAFEEVAMGESQEEILGPRGSPRGSPRRGSGKMRASMEISPRKNRLDIPSGT